VYVITVDNVPWIVPLPVDSKRYDLAILDNNCAVPLMHVRGLTEPDGHFEKVAFSF
jgi:hypothetical protein